MNTMKNVAGIYGDITGRSFEFLHFYATRALRKNGLSHDVVRQLTQALKSHDFERVLSSWREIVGVSITDDAVRYVQEHTPYRFTDDTILTIATMDALLKNPGNPDFKTAYYTWAQKYRESGFGGSFKNWIELPFEEAHPYGSFGNGSAMRVGPVGYRAETFDEVALLATKSAECTHNSPEGIRGARAIADVILLADTGATKNHIREHIEKVYFYDLNRSHADIQKDYRFEVSCQKSVPESITCFLESTSIQSAIDLAISLGGDADTQAMMSGYMAEAFYGNVPTPMIDLVESALPEEMLDVLYRYNETL